MPLRNTLPAALLVLSRVLSAQAQGDTLPGDGQTRDDGRCRGQIVSAIEIKPGRPPFSGTARFWRTAAHAVGLHHSTTKPQVVASFLDVSVGHACTERRRAESERVLRAQPFLANATVRAVPDTGGTVRLEVTTVDEVTVLVNGRLHGGVPAAFALGNGNMFGRGIALEGGVERGFAYRDGVSLVATDYAAFGKPFLLGVDLARSPRGEHVSTEMAHPFFTDLQRNTWHVGVRQDENYLSFLRPADDGLALDMRSTTWDASFAQRVRTGNLVTLLGAALTHRSLEPASRGILVTTDGLRPDSGVALDGRYRPFTVTRLSALAGIRRVRYVSVSGFDALTAPEDVPVGVQVVGTLGGGIPAFGARDLFTSSSTYAGLAGPTWRLAAQVDAEMRREAATGRWDDMIASARAAWYLKESSRALLVVSDELSVGSRTIAPMQLTLGAREFGVRGYEGSTFAGAQRLITRVEQRVVLGGVRGKADIGLAAFADAGTVWAGDAPYGQDVTRASVGLSVLGAIPQGSKRLYRVDFAFPVATSSALGGSSRFTVQLVSADLTRLFWRDPSDVSSARLGVVPASVMALPSR